MSDSTSSGENTLKLLVAWLWVGIPLAWGVWQVVVKTFSLFK